MQKEAKHFYVKTIIFIIVIIQHKMDLVWVDSLKHIKQLY